MDKFQPKNAIDRKREEERRQEDSLADFQGSQGELILLKIARWVSHHRKVLGFGLLAVIVALTLGVGIYEYRESKIQTETEALEELFESQKKNELSLEKRIESLVVFSQNHGTGSVALRLAKEKSRLYAEAKDWKNAALLLEESGRKITEPKEMKALYFYLAGNYRDLSEEKLLSAQNYEIAANLLETNTETPSFKAWAHYQTGRLKMELGKPEEAKSHLEKVLKLEASGRESLEDIKLYAAYLLLRSGQP